MNHRQTAKKNLIDLSAIRMRALGSGGNKMAYLRDVRENHKKAENSFKSAALVRDGLSG